MWVEISEEQYFRLVKSANERNISVEKHIESMQAKFTDIEQTFMNFNQEEIDHFKLVLQATISEIIQSQEDLANSDEGTMTDKVMVDILNILFGRATRNKMIFAELCGKYYEILGTYL